MAKPSTIPPWVDLIAGEVGVEYCAVQTDGGVKILTENVTIPCTTYGEVCKLSGNDVVTTTHTSNITLSVNDVIYSVRLYSKELSSTNKAKNAEIDQNRWGIPADALWLDGGTDTLCLDGGDFLCVDH